MERLLEQGLAAPIGDNLALHKLLTASLRRKGRLGTSIESPGVFLPWGEHLFSLPLSPFYQKLPPYQKQAILRECNAFVLEETYFIEKAGLTYAAKMLLLSETLETKQMYGLIASDEATHLSWLSPFVPVKQRLPSTPLLSFLSALMEENDLSILHYLVQTVLEGWGLAYYQTLATHCQEPLLKALLLDIMKDEAIHHKTGLALLQTNPLTCNHRKKIKEGIKQYTEILRSSHYAVIRSVENQVGELSFKDLSCLFEALDSQSASLVKLEILKKIMRHPLIDPWLAELEEEGFFTAYSPEKAARSYCKLRNHCTVIP